MSDRQEPSTERKDRLLVAVLANVPFDGWSQASIDAAAASMEMSEEDTRLCFPDGVPSAMAHFSDWADRGMVAEIQAAGSTFSAFKVREKIAYAVRARLDFIEPHKEAVRLLTAAMASPAHARLGPRLVWKTVDTMWYEAGDTATDFNHYTKRGLLAGVQASTVLFWLADKSEGHESTWAFLDRRIENVLAVGMRIGRLRNAGERMPDLSKVMKWMPFARRKEAEGSADTEGGSRTVH